MFHVLFAFKSFGWGDRGHKIVAQIAKNCLNKSIADSVQFYLGKMSFKRASVWMDEVRSDESYNYMKPWHYINVAKDSSYFKTDEENVVNEIEKAITVLKNKRKHTKEEIGLAIKILFHLIGDLHQPLHAGYAEDKGGNKVDVDFLGEYTNLHKVWDTHIIEQGKIRLKDCYISANALSREESMSFQNVNVEGWMNESRSFLPEVYNFEKRIITRAYIDKNKEIIKKQLVKASIRLAAVLHQAFVK